MPVPAHRVGAMIGVLGAKPPVKCRDELGVGDTAGQLRTAVHVPLVDSDLPRLRGLEVGQARHLIAMDMRWPRKVIQQELALTLVASGLNGERRSKQREICRV